LKKGTETMKKAPGIKAVVAGAKLQVENNPVFHEELEHDSDPPRQC
jgi:hypothetical protein